MRIVMIDNYDSFTFNLVQYLGELGAAVDVFRNDAAGIADLFAPPLDGVVISPGPGVPENAGVSLEVVGACAKQGVPLLGVCLGHQAIGVFFGGRIVRARAIMHGKLSSIAHDGRGVFAGLASPFEATRYHSLVIAGDACPESLEVSARSEDGEIMGVRHCEHPIEGVQFHPESIMTPLGKPLLANFLRRCADGAAA